MTNTSMLEERIRKSGIKKKKVAETLGISYTSLRKKMDNVVGFKADEILKICKLLGVDSSDVCAAIFFNESVDKMPTKRKKS